MLLGTGIRKMVGDFCIDNPLREDGLERVWMYPYEIEHVIISALGANPWADDIIYLENVEEGNGALFIDNTIRKFHFKMIDCGEDLEIEEIFE